MANSMMMKITPKLIEIILHFLPRQINRGNADEVIKALNTLDLPIEVTEDYLNNEFILIHIRGTDQYGRMTAFGKIQVKELESLIGTHFRNVVNPIIARDFSYKGVKFNFSFGIDFYPLP